MPPVLGPLSPSPTRLWSWAVPMGRQSVPSERMKKLASSPSMNSSMTTDISPNSPSKMASMAAWASATVMATVTPLPAASPSALITMGAPRAVT